MALTAQQLEECRHELSRSGITVNYTKAQVNAALTALDAWWESTGRAAAGAAIEAAAPGVFTGPQKLKIGKYWLLTKAGVE
jgi:hypothetical protein